MTAVAEITRSRVSGRLRVQGEEDLGFSGHIVNKRSDCVQDMLPMALITNRASEKWEEIIVFALDSVARGVVEKIAYKQDASGVYGHS